jgi:LytS/YehU family sensor histidine kinase
MADNSEDITWIILTGASLSSTVYYYIKSSRARRKAHEVELLLKEATSTIDRLEIDNAATKLNPHLLKNTLNTIHSLSWQTTNAIEKLSEMLRYILYESGKKYVTLKDEVDFVNAYFKVHQLKLSPLTRVKLEIADGVRHEKLLVAPLLTVNFLENAFVHGNFTSTDCFLNVHISLQAGNTLLYEVSNTFTPSQKQPGIGNQNFRKRLDLLHQDKYQIEQFANAASYTARLRLILNES